MSDLLARASTVRDEARRTPELPERVLGYLDAIVGELEAREPDATRLSASAHGLMQWYLDQGFAGVPLHARLAALAHEALRYAKD